MFLELCIICFIVFALWIIGKLLMLFDIVHVPKKRVHYWRHVKHLNHVSSIQLYTIQRCDATIDKMFAFRCSTGMLLFHLRDHVNVQRFLL